MADKSDRYLVERIQKGDRSAFGQLFDRYYALFVSFAKKLLRDDQVVEDPCLTDHYHAGTTTGGRYLNACVFYEVLLGKSCIGNVSDGLSYALDRTLAERLQLAAHQAVAAMYGEDHAK